jgi:hypothetical protein
MSFFLQCHANQEIKFFFPDFDEAAFFTRVEPQLWFGEIVVFDPESYVHRIQPALDNPSS